MASHRTNFNHGMGMDFGALDTIGRGGCSQAHRLVEVSYPMPGQVKTMRMINNFHRTKIPKRDRTG